MSRAHHENDYILTDRRRYDEIRSLYIDQLVSVWMNSSTTIATRASFDSNFDRFARGELGHATEMLSTLWEVINRDGEIRTPSNTSPPSNTSLAVSQFGVAFFRVARECLLHMIRPQKSQAPNTGPL